jgi:membrane protein
VLGLRAVMAGRRVLDNYSAAGGGLLADGLAYTALFAVVPAILLAVTIAGFVISDPSQRSQAVAVIGSVVPPLHDIVNAILAQASTNAGALGIIGLVTLAWSASRFVVAFADAIGRVMGRTTRRGFLIRNAAAVGSVLLLVVAILGAPTIAGLASFLDTAEATGVLAIVGGTLRAALGAIPPLVTVAAIGLVYRVVPVPSPRWRALWVPSIVVGIVLTLLVQVFVFLAPRLVGSAALLGTIAVVFAALAWFSLSFQALLIGAAWVREREPAEPTIGPVAPLAESGNSVPRV